MVRLFFLSTWLSFAVLCGGVVGCLPLDVDVSSEDPFELAQQIVPGESTRQDVHALLGHPGYSSAVWGAEVFHPSVEAKQYWFGFWGVWRRSRPLGPYILVTYSRSGTVGGVRSYEDPDCDFNCGSRLKMGSFHGLDLDAFSGDLLAPKAESAELLERGPTSHECVLYVTPRGFGIASLYLDGHFVANPGASHYLRLALMPGEHILTCRVNARWTGDSTPGHPFVESEHQNPHTDWAFGCEGGTSLQVWIEARRDSRWERYRECAITPSSGSELAQDLAGRRMIIPFDAATRSPEQ